MPQVQGNVRTGSIMINQLYLLNFNSELFEIGIIYTKIKSIKLMNFFRSVIESKVSSLPWCPKTPKSTPQTLKIWAATSLRKNQFKDATSNTFVATFSTTTPLTILNGSSTLSKNISPEISGALTPFIATIPKLILVASLNTSLKNPISSAL